MSVPLSHAAESSGFEPEELGLCPVRWRRVCQYAERLCDEGVLPAVSLQFQREGRTTRVESFGTQRLGNSVPVDDQTLFLIASLTKPIIAMAMLLLVERGQIALNQRVIEFLPMFRDAAKRSMTIRHLLSHTSGLPDMLPNNHELRKLKSPLSAFVEGTAKVALVYPVGRGTQYQSMGYALLGPIIEAATGVPYQQFIKQELFEPLGMTRSWLGLPESMRGEENIAEVRVPDEQDGGVDWNWNSTYWRELGAPWGGMLSTAADLSRFCAAMTGAGSAEKRSLTADNRSRTDSDSISSNDHSAPHPLPLSPEYRGEGSLKTVFARSPLLSEASIEEATTNRLEDFQGINEIDRRTRAWGLGWRMNWKDHRSSLCELLPATICGHWGATGTLFWIDRQRQTSLVLLSTQPTGEGVSPLSMLSNMAAAAIV
ncbi:serine hydrolase domain-containing protein [Planctomicrobium piriforme]|uniref:CubicO group peptidase, beta-lactamase class C family n=1 Tax=Planctomicrobium piriforme TaxID=1576369 RepID=A0A1I3GJ44_9PLAN|nr:serine hydrolase domain-containing protein [Planctomicrobium piriforme]SFI23447.1 CubicO group peptidase, beta-lactamase class C family [Planctomicrobium piriforme]